MEHSLNKAPAKGGGALRELLAKYRNFVFLGEAGSGKTELCVNIAMLLAGEWDNIHLFDIDQTKPLFRARDLSAMLEAGDVKLHYQPQFQDIPTMVPGIIESLNDGGRRTLIDVGGGVHGALMAGQLAKHINDETTCVFYTVNVYRPWSGSARGIADTRRAILEASRVMRVHIVANPTLGASTLPEEVTEGDRLLDGLLGEDAKADFICVSESLLEKVEKSLSKPVIVIRPGINMTGSSGGF